MSLRNWPFGKPLYCSLYFVDILVFMLVFRQSKFNILIKAIFTRCKGAKCFSGNATPFGEYQIVIKSGSLLPKKLVLFALVKAF